MRLNVRIALALAVLRLSRFFPGSPAAVAASPARPPRFLPPSSGPPLRL